MPASIMRLTALPPPPPIPITFMRAPVIGGSSSMKILMPLSSLRASVGIVMSSLPKREGFHGLFLLCWVARGIGLDILRTISCTTGAKAYNNLSKNTTETITKFRDKVRELARRATPAYGAPPLAYLCTTCYQRQTGGRGPRRTLNILNQATKSISLGETDANGRIENLFGDLRHAAQECAAAR